MKPEKVISTDHINSRNYSLYYTLCHLFGWPLFLFEYISIPNAMISSSEYVEGTFNGFIELVGQLPFNILLVYLT
ncbi:MAG: hypothetical protein H0U27_02120 [Nitrosopumilus sp.]|nr:hypothetical protein [Nitrosopumilus sp.]